jgi:hypothetical protein
MPQEAFRIPIPTGPKAQGLLIHRILHFLKNVKKMYKLQTFSDITPVERR